MTELNVFSELEDSRYSKYKNKGLTGLANIGNTCYINSCLQLLSHTYELNDFFDSKKTMRVNKTNDGMLLLEWNNLRKLMWSENCIIAPWGFVRAVQKVSMIKQRDLFTGFTQQDMSEFLLFIIECFHEGLKRDVDMTISGVVEDGVDSLARDCYSMMKNLYKKEYSEMLNIFYGISVTEISSIETGKHLSRCSEPFSLISLCLPLKKEITIFECLDNHCANEVMNGENAWYNDKTQKKEGVTKRIMFWSLPNVLIIDLKRYNNDNRKLQMMVNTPLTDVDFSKYVVGYDPQQYVYDLYGVTNHSGNVYGGHYTAAIKNANGKWYNYNDTSINEINETLVITPKTYCLFYRKKNKN